MVKGGGGDMWVYDYSGWQMAVTRSGDGWWRQVKVIGSGGGWVGGGEDDDGVWWY